MSDFIDFLVTGQQLRRLYDRILNQVGEEYGLGRQELDVLLFLKNNPDYDMAKDIVEYRGLAKSCVSRGIDLLVKKGYLEAKADQKDRRLVHLKLLPEAGEAAQAACHAQRRCIEILYKGLTEEEKKMMSSICLLYTSAASLQ